MDVSTIDTSGLGDRSYLICQDSTAVVIDPQRDIDRFLNLADDRAVTITHVLETHIHNDYVTGGLELARKVGAQYVVPSGEDVSYDCVAVADGDIIDAGLIQLQVIHTPGHTHHHVSYVLHDTTDSVVGVFTGGSMLYGTTGRTDLVGGEYTRALTHAQYRSVRRLADELPGHTEVYPTHGFGSFCAATPASGDSSTIAEQRHNNPALTQDEQAYVTELLDGLIEYPGFYAHMGVINRRGPDPVDLSMPDPVDPEDLRRRIDAGDWVIDLRNRTAFADRHLYRTLAFELSDSFATYLGWLYDWGTPLILTGDSEEQIAYARRELVRIGIDKIDGAAVGDINSLRAHSDLWAYRIASFGDLAKASATDSVSVLDVRQAKEFDSSHVAGAMNIQLHELIDRVAEVPNGEVWVHCASGYRASIAASIIDRLGHHVVLIDDAYDNAEQLGLTTANDR
jgi:hydroxyacylglutathione hydrolase